MLSLGKNRSRLGRWLDDRGIKQEWLVSKSRIGRTTISNACANEHYMPSGSTIQKMMKALKEIDPTVQSNQFWDI
ncbi:helix-turn-helix domain-containing protein [Paenibacillus piri]|uniref:XRE family transcriptional regulator n=1 Tax=Paenibacillus piri TaxID=2547395 RepID=A0A4R5KEC4_9BACL|nr:helix-turn-helix transcriptional regulator [Paenibacillus piri]TDF93576.1 XRE family transcriptional regulator [Paenibacillus piri]